MSNSKTRVQKKKNGQFVVTIPRGLGESMSLEGERVSWKVVSSKSLKLEVVKE